VYETLATASWLWCISDCRSHVDARNRSASAADQSLRFSVCQSACASSD